MTNEIVAKTELAIASIEPQSELENVVDAIQLLDAIKEWVKEQQESMNLRLIEYLQANGEFQFGSVKYWLGATKPDWKCIDVAACLEAVKIKAECVDADGEAVVDWRLVADCLSANAFKPGATRKFLGDDAGKHFVLPEPKPKVENDAPKPERRAKVEGPSVQTLNLDFLR